MIEYSGRTFKCQQCRGIYYELTATFEPVPPMRGSYVSLLPRYGVNGYNWYDFPHNDWTIGDNVACVNCGYPIKMDYVLKNLEPLIEEPGGLQKDEEKSCVVKGIGEDGGGSSGIDCANTGASSDGDGLYDSSELGDKLLNDVLFMTAQGKTQADIAETCGISVYRVRKFQNGEIS